MNIFAVYDELGFPDKIYFRLLGITSIYIKYFVFIDNLALKLKICNDKLICYY